MQTQTQQTASPYAGAFPVNSLLKDVNKFITHSQHVFEHANHRGWAETKLRLIDDLKREVSRLHASPSFRFAAMEIVKMEIRLKSILPSPKNPSYASSCEKLAEIIKACQTAQPKMNWTI